MPHNPSNTPSPSHTKPPKSASGSDVPHCGSSEMSCAGQPGPHSGSSTDRKDEESIGPDAPTADQLSSAAARTMGVKCLGAMESESASSDGLSTCAEAAVAAHGHAIPKQSGAQSSSDLLTSITITKPEIDKLYRDKKCQLVPADFTMTISFSPL
mmetsp:Transcript_19812/g.27831  ORF Transcript_19812/g.27831 Transcript_19812/m.27831 type:complete len:155 (-) Transcript_19812:78-542(-)